MIFLWNKSNFCIFVMNQKQLMALSKKELVDRCNAKQLDTRGTKFDLVKRLLSSSENSIIHSIVHHRPIINIEKNKFNQYVHKDTLLVFDFSSQIVVGKKSSFEDDEQIYPLTYNDIQNCLKYKFRFRLPDNLADSINICNKVSNYDKDSGLRKRLLAITTSTDDNNDEDDEEENEEDE